MPASGRPWSTLLASFKKECATQQAPCWICHQAIDYSLVGRQSQAFSADHVTPTSLDGEALKRSNLKPSHYGCNASRGNTTRGMFPGTRRW